MRHNLLLRLIALISLFSVTTCQSSATPSVTPVTTPSAMPTSDASATPEMTPSAMPTSVASATPKMTFSPTPTTERIANADVLYVRAVQVANGTWTFHVTVEHPDSGWEDYADGWDVLTPDDTVLKPDPDSPFTRLLLHPHENEQPFTRSQSGIAIPDGVTQIRVRAHDLVDGFGGREVLVDLTLSSGPDFEVEQ